VSILPIVEFDRRMEAASVVAGMRVTQDGALVQGVVEPLEGGRRYRFRPDRPFAAGAFVRIVLPMSILTLEGRHPHDWNILGFSIRGPGSAPDKLMLTRVSVTSALPANAPLDLEFSSPLAPGSVHRDAVWLSDGHRLVPAAVELRGPASVRITPDESLTPGREYVLTIGAALRGEQAEAFPGARVVFSAGPEAAPVLVSREEIDWRGEPAWRLRFSHPITPVEAEALRGKGSGEIALAADGLMLVVPGRRTEVPEVLAPGQPVPLQRRRAGR
jgi:hypothetical protein